MATVPPMSSMTWLKGKGCRSKPLSCPGVHVLDRPASCHRNPDVPVDHPRRGRASTTREPSSLSRVLLCERVQPPGTELLALAVPRQPDIRLHQALGWSFLPQRSIAQSSIVLRKQVPLSSASRNQIPQGGLNEFDQAAGGKTAKASRSPIPTPVLVILGLIGCSLCKGYHF